MRKIDPNTWPRRDIFDFFSKISNPFYSVTFNVDVTEAYAYAKRSGLSFYYALVYLVTRAINSVEAFRYALVDGELVLLDERSPSFTDLKKGSESFHIVTMPCKGDIAEFCFDAMRRSAEIEVPTIDGRVKLTIPEGTQPGSVFRLRGKGIPYLQSKGGGRGDQFVTITVTVPKNMTAEQKERLRAYADAMNESVSESRSGIFGNKKKR